jgi:hypothetical protein
MVSPPLIRVPPNASRHSLLDSLGRLGDVLATVPAPNVIEGDPQRYRYHPRTALALGLGFDPADPTSPKRPAIIATKEELDAGAPGTHLAMTYVREWDQLNFAMKVDSKVDASFLAFKGNSNYQIDVSTAFQSNSITVVLTAESDFGRWGLSADAKLNEDAKKYLSNGREFARIFGSRYVVMERRGASVSAVITLSSVREEYKASFDAEFGASGGWGDLSAGAKTKFHAALSKASKEDRLTVQVGATGGIGLAALKETIEKLSIEKDATDAILKALASSLGGFNKTNASPVEYVVASMDYFGWDPTANDVWTDDKERKLRDLAAAYREAGVQLDFANTIENGTCPLNKVMEQKYVGWIRYKVAIKNDYLLPYISKIEGAHKKCKTDPTADCEVPLRDFAEILGQEERWMLRPPQALFYVRGVTAGKHLFNFNYFQSGAILRARKGNRVAVAKTFVPETVSVFIGLNIQGSLFASSLAVFQYADGSTFASDEHGAAGTLSYLWAQEPMEEGDPYKNQYYEDLIYNFLAQHSGSFEGVEIVQVRDEMERVFRVPICHVAWTADGRNVTRADVELYPAWQELRS